MTEVVITACIAFAVSFTVSTVTVFCVLVSAARLLRGRS